ncbi:hypothetical protein [Pseudomonas sp. BN411]|uniref:hypothetical protein n=1 Tax=Pseudomonas sp. BN411 TaxID=2567887 RepID=UPI0024549DF0|nr:hypothetical protein [Pseudomonas sp. BN411]
MKDATNLPHADAGIAIPLALPNAPATAFLNRSGSAHLAIAAHRASLFMGRLAG